MSVIKMFVQAVATPNVQTAGIDVPLDGVLEAVTLGVACNNPTPTAGDVTTAEVSFLSSPTFTTNDARGSLCQVASLVSGAAAADGLKQLPSVPFCIVNGLSVPVSSGERIFIHLQNTFPDGNSNAIAYLFIRDQESVRRQTRRR